MGISVAVDCRCWHLKDLILNSKASSSDKSYYFLPLLAGIWWALLYELCSFWPFRGFFHICKYDKRYHCIKISSLIFTIVSHAAPPFTCSEWNDYSRTSEATYPQTNLINVSRVKWILPVNKDCSLNFRLIIWISGPRHTSQLLVFFPVLIQDQNLLNTSTYSSVTCLVSQVLS